MEENKNLELESIQENEEKSSFDFATIYTVLILNWKWFVLSLSSVWAQPTYIALCNANIPICSQTLDQG